MEQLGTHQTKTEVTSVTISKFFRFLLYLVLCSMFAFSFDDLDEDDLNKDDDGSDINDIEGGAEEEPLNSEDDVTDEDNADLFETDNVVVCQYDKVNLLLPIPDPF